MTRRIRNAAMRAMIGALASAALLALWTQVPAAQEPSAPPAAAADTGYAPIPVPDIPEAMGYATDFTLHREDTLGYRVPVRAFSQRAQALLDELRARGPATDSLLAVRPSLRTMENLFSEWSERRSGFEDAIKDGRALGRRLFVRSYTLDSLDRVFELTADRHGEQLPRARLDGIDTLRARIADRLELETSLSAHVDSLLLELVRGEREVSRIQDDIKRTESELRGQLLSRDAPPLWALFAAAPPSAMSEFGRSAADNWSAIQEFVARRGSDLLLLGLVFVALVLLLMLSRQQVLEWGDAGSARRVVSHVLSRPVSSATLFTVLLAFYLLVAIPVAVRDVLGILLVVPFLRVALGLVPAAYVRPVLVLAGLYLMDKLVGLFGEQILLWRLSLLLRSGIGCLVILYVARQVQRGVAPPATYRVLLLWLSWIGAALLGLATVGNLLGFAALTLILTEGVLNSIFVGLVLLVLHPIINGIVLLLLRSPLMNRSRYLARVEVAILENLDRITRLALTLTWIWAVLNLFRASRPVLDHVTALLTARLEMGAASLSLGGILAFIAVAWFGVAVARILSSILEEDVLDRMGMPRGVPAAIGRVTQIALIALVVALAAATAGVELSQLALLTGALGVGIGFGMQNVVNNFMSGLILMFERPIAVDDIVEVGTVVGKVQKIGFRSSTIKTFEGSSVIVPNGNLISSEVTNWTHLDQSRRIDLPIGVAYGTDPQRVIDLLVQTAAAHPEVSGDPEPIALFQQFGDNSLNFVLRYWTHNFPRWVFIASEVTVAVNQAFADAGIEIPFPQRTLHVASWSPEARPPAGEAPGPAGGPARPTPQEPPAST